MFPEWFQELWKEFCDRLIYNVIKAFARLTLQPGRRAAISDQGTVAAAWAEVKTSNDPKLIQLFLEKYNDSFYQAIARAKLEETTRSKTIEILPPSALPSLK